MAYERPPARKMYIVLDDEDQDPTHPDQEIGFGGWDLDGLDFEVGCKLGVGWINSLSRAYIYGWSRQDENNMDDKDETPAEVHYGTVQGELGSSATGSTRSYNFKTPPSQFPIRLAVAGDLDRRKWTKSTLDHISKSNYDLLLLAGDLSYADFYQPLWDSFGRLVEPLASQRPWMTRDRQHDVEKIIVSTRRIAGVHVVVLGSYTDFGSDSDQYKWLQADLGKVDRKRTPWLVVMLHAPWYNSNSAHQGEEESDGMRDSMEEILYKARVDVVFAGHVHAYERFDRVYQGKTDKCGPVYITIGDGGNREGLATKYNDPKPDISLFREASFGHGQLNVVDENTMEWTWHRNDDDQSVAADSVKLKSLATEPGCN
ncbi:putative purple acid phosphatase 20 [Vitis vinifera]|uniref:acid phosphatase n=1 Tax=Vitis vinifera TaxID=29760 RepID=A0A438EK84_VITVI|nr:putative purple acid phosphatase 20 [Vitis vinifera]